MSKSSRIKLQDEVESMLFVQHIVTKWWCDAAVEHPPPPPLETPLALPVPYFDPDLEGLCHRVRHTEEEKFHRVEFVEPLEFKLGLRIGSTLTTKQFHLLLVDFVWSAETTGLPARPSKRALILEMGQWGRIISDGLVCDQSDSDERQMVRRDVVNICNCNSLEANLFVETDPVDIVDQQFRAVSQ